MKGMCWGRKRMRKHIHENTAEILKIRGNAVSSSASSGPRIIRSADLFAGMKEVIIEHEHDQYRLRCTSKGKLILTK